MALPALAGAAVTAGLAGIGDLLFNLLARKGGRKATSSVVRQLLGKDGPFEHDEYFHNAAGARFF